MSDIAFATLGELAQGLAAGRYSSVELARHYLDRIDRANPALGAYVSVDHDGALKLAEAADARRRAGYGLLGPLDGLPVAVKDLCDIQGQVTTAGSQAWRQRRSSHRHRRHPPLTPAWWCPARRTWWSSPSAAGARIP